MPQERIQEIINAFDPFDDRYRRPEMDEALPIAILGIDHGDFDDRLRFEVNRDFLDATGDGLRPFFAGINSRKQKQPGGEE